MAKEKSKITKSSELGLKKFRRYQLWNTKTGKLLRTIKGHDKAIFSVAFSRDGQTLASGSWDKTIKLWNTQTGELRQNLIGHNKAVWSVAFIPEGDTLASGSADETIKLWQVSPYKPQLQPTITTSRLFWGV